MWTQFGDEEWIKTAIRKYEYSIEGSMHINESACHSNATHQKEMDCNDIV